MIGYVRIYMHSFTSAFSDPFPSAKPRSAASTKDGCYQHLHSNGLCNTSASIILSTCSPLCDQGKSVI